MSSSTIDKTKILHNFIIEHLGNDKSPVSIANKLLQHEVYPLLAAFSAVVLDNFWEKLCHKLMEILDEIFSIGEWKRQVHVRCVVETLDFHGRKIPVETWQVFLGYGDPENIIWTGIVLEYDDKMKIVRPEIRVVIDGDYLEELIDALPISRDLARVVTDIFLARFIKRKYKLLLNTTVLNDIINDLECLRRLMRNDKDAEMLDALIDELKKLHTIMVTGEKEIEKEISRFRDLLSLLS